MSLLYSVIALVIHQVSCLSLPEISKTLKNIPEDGLFDFTRLARKYGHPATVHHVTTNDGYSLTLFNMPGDKNRPVLMQHGVFDSADGWILRGNRSLAVILADEGYDVWLSNHRGSKYSRVHKTLDPNTDAKFWDFSVHELGFYDLAANIDYVLNATGQSKVTLIGFSEGTTMSFVLGATRPEYNDKVKISISLAPIAYLHNTIGPLRFLILFGTFLNEIIPKFINEIGGFHSVSKAMMNWICTQWASGYDLCFGGLVSPLIGPNTESIDVDFFYNIVAHVPAGTSKKNLIHFSQIGLCECLAAYDYGKEKNIQVYGTPAPPLYELEKVTMRAVMISGRNDRVSTIPDVQILCDKLPNVQEWKILEDPMYNHLDHMWAKDAFKVVYPFVLETLAKSDG